MNEKILGLIPQAEWLNVGLDVSRPNDPLEAVMGDVRTGNIMAAWQTIAAEYRAPLMASFHGFDTESLRTFRVPVDAHNVEKGLIKVKLNQSERLRSLLRTGVQESELSDYVIRDGLRLADQVVTRSKAAKAELLATGKVTIKENGLDLTVDYGVPSEQLQLTLKLDADADVPAQLQTIVDKAAEKGITLTGMITARKNLTRMRQNPAVQSAIGGALGGQVSRAAFEAYAADEFGLTQVITDDLTYGLDGGMGKDGRPAVTLHRYFPDDRVSFFAANAAGQVGAGLWGDPPEAALPGAAAEGSAAPFVYVTQKMEWDPAVLWTKASGLFMPVLYDPAGLWVASVSGE